MWSFYNQQTPAILLLCAKNVFPHLGLTFSLSVMSFAKQMFLILMLFNWSVPPFYTVAVQVNFSHLKITKTLPWDFQKTASWFTCLYTRLLELLYGDGVRLGFSFIYFLVRLSNGFCTVRGKSATLLLCSGHLCHRSSVRVHMGLFHRSVLVIWAAHWSLQWSHTVWIVVAL